MPTIIAVHGRHKIRGAIVSQTQCGGRCRHKHVIRQRVGCRTHVSDGIAKSGRLRSAHVIRHTSRAQGALRQANTLARCGRELRACIGAVGTGLALAREARV
jgi:hypothetical protein